MGLGRRIRRAFRRTVGRAFRSTVGFVKDGFKAVKNTVSDLKDAVKGVVGDVLGQLPFGNVIKGLVEQFLDNPMALLSQGPLAAVAAVVGFATSTDMLSQVVGGITGSQAFGNPQAAQNVLNTVAQQHAKLMFPGLF